MKELRFYALRSGKEPFKEWLNQLRDSTGLLKINNRISRLTLGQYGDIERVGKDLFEIRIHFGPGYRIYFAEFGRRIVILLLGGDKGSQKQDIDRVKLYWKDYLEQCDEKNQHKKG